MPNVQRYRAVACLAICLCAFGSASAQAPQARPAAPPAIDPLLRTMQEDAELADVFFVDTDHGWAVGDRGAIWTTVDAGSHWQLQRSGVTCRLESVQFLDAKTGWAVGGSTLPFTPATSGVLLRTTDGGQTWTPDKAMILPWLHKIQFFSSTVGWAIGEASTTFPSGAFSTDNGGRTWSPLPIESKGWVSAAFADAHTGALVGRQGLLASIAARQSALLPHGELSLRPPRAVALEAAGHGWLVGDAGLVLFTHDAGHTWNAPPAPLPPESESFDWRTVKMWGAHVWIAGSPGNRMLHSANAGHTWEWLETPQRVPIQAMTFLNDHQGCAVGALGNVLMTADGGHSWRAAHSGGSRAAMVALFGRAESVPLAMLAQLSADDGYLTQVEVLAREDYEPNRSAAAPERTHEALIAAGASSATTLAGFPVQPAELHFSAEQIVALWDRMGGENSAQRLEDRLVREIRIWRPDVVVTHAPSPRGDDPLGHLINQLVLRAVTRAADATSATQEKSRTGLEPWQAKKVLARNLDGQLGSINLASGQVGMRIGRPFSEVALQAEGRISLQYKSPPESLGFQLLVDHVPQGAGERDFFSGIMLQAGGEARRVLAASAGLQSDPRNKSARQRNVQGLIEHGSKLGLTGERLLAETGELTKGLDDAAAAGVLFELAQRLVQTGRWNVAVDVFDTLVTRYPQQPLTRPALVWLVRYWSSEELAWCSRRAPAPEVQQAVAFGAPAGGAISQVQQASAVVTGAKFQVQTAGQTGTAAVDRQTRAAASAKAAAYAKALENWHSVVAAEPDVQFPLIAARRPHGPSTDPLDRYLLYTLHTRPHDAWWSCAAAEQWLLAPRGDSPQPLYKAASRHRPYLDGELDDDTWRDAAALELHSPLRDDADWPAAVKLAHDDQFLYLGVRCRRAAGCSYTPSVETRTRDADLSGSDRVELYLDVDRDRATAYRFVVDYRGWSAEDCAGDAAWNPEWFIASGGDDDDTWSVEAAIPLEALSGQSAGGNVWAMGVQRIAPTVGFQSWSSPAAPEAMAEGFGLLRLE